MAHKTKDYYLILPKTREFVYAKKDKEANRLRLVKSRRPSDAELVRCLIYADYFEKNRSRRAFFKFLWESLAVLEVDRFEDPALDRTWIKTDKQVEGLPVWREV